IFSGDAEFVKVPQCKTGRVFLLKFKAGRRCFYWMQEPREDKDEEFFKKVNDLITNPPPAGSRNSNSNSLTEQLTRQLEEGGGAELSTLLNNMNPQQLMQMLGMQVNQGSGRSSRTTSANRQPSGGSSGGNVAVSPPAASPPVSTGESKNSKSSTPQAQIQLSDLRNIISSLTVPGQQSQANKEEIDLSSAINSEALQTLISNEEFMTRVSAHLPPVTAASETSAEAPESSPSEDLSSTVQSPQFKQALRTFSTALQSGQLGPLMLQFGLSQACVDAANEGDLEKFVKALEESEKSKESESAKDDDMALD
ncbi:proteasomal ubiquitin receptor ADRM1-like protein, partial [Leptotrombidium deliense]